MAQYRTQGVKLVWVIDTIQDTRDKWVSVKG